SIAAAIRPREGRLPDLGARGGAALGRAGEAAPVRWRAVLPPGLAGIAGARVDDLTTHVGVGLFQVVQPREPEAEDDLVRRGVVRAKSRRLLGDERRGGKLEHVVVLDAC